LRLATTESPVSQANFGENNHDIVRFEIYVPITIGVGDINAK